MKHSFIDFVFIGIMTCGISAIILAVTKYLNRDFMHPVEFFLALLIFVGVIAHVCVKHAHSTKKDSNTQ